MGSSMHKINSAIELGAVVDRVINESIKSAYAQKALDEKEKQAAVAPETTEPAAPAPEPEPSKTMTDDTEAMKGNVTLDQIIEKLNTIRSGKSFKDSMIKSRFEQYFGSLSNEEKTAMFVFLKGIAQVVTGETPPEEFADPSKAPSGIKMQKGPAVKTKHVKPNVIKNPLPPPGKKTSTGAENTTPPIAAKKR